MVLFCFLKDSQQSIHFKYFNTVKIKETKTWKTIVCYIKQQHVTDKTFTLCVLLHVPEMHISQIMTTAALSPQWGRRKVWFVSSHMSTSRPTPWLYQERLKPHCLWHTKRLVVSAHSRKGQASLPTAGLDAPTSRLSPHIFFLPASLHHHSTPGQLLWAFASRNTYLQIHIQGRRGERYYKEFIAVFVSSLHRNKTTMKSA